MTAAGTTQQERRTAIPGWGALLALLVLVLGAGVLHLSQGTSGMGLDELFGPDGAARDVLLGSRLPRLAAGIAVGAALGIAGALLQSLSRNPLASPDTLGVTAGSYLAVTAVAAFGVSLPLWSSGVVAFVGGLAAAGLVLGLAGGAGSSTTRLILAGSAVALALQALTSTLLILFQEETKGLLAWGNGSLSQLNLDAALQAAPVILVVLVLALGLSRRLDILALGDDAARSLGVPLRATRGAGVVLGVVLAAVAVTVAGPIGFVGLVAPVITRLLARLVPRLHRHLLLLPATGLVGAVIVLIADVVLRAVLGAEEALTVPTGVATSILGAIVLIAMARRLRDSGATRQPPRVRVRSRSARRYAIVLVFALALAGGAVFTGLLAGSTWLLSGDVLLWLQGAADPAIAFAFDERAPRVTAALLAGAALALSGSLVQATSRNPLADPGILGITGGAGLGAVFVVTSSVGGALASASGLTAAAVAGALLSFGLIYGLAWRRGINADRLILMGIGISYGATALSTFFLLRANPWDTPRIYTWLSGTTYGRVWEQIVPVLVVLVVVVPVVLVLRREIDLLAVDEDTPRMVGVATERTRLVLLALAAFLAAVSVSAVGVLGFVGLVAPHAARALVGAKSSRYIPVALLLGGALVVVADILGRTLIAPAQVPAGLMVALVGAPYFVWLLGRSRDA